MKQVRYYTPLQLRSMTANHRVEFKNLFKELKKRKDNWLDQQVHDMHNEAFISFDCLTCANCCSSISPIVTEKDAERLAKSLKMKVGRFIEQYLYIDEDSDYVFKDTPCPFLMNDNYCSSYGDRPKACREYPHTDRPRFHQILSLTMKNCEICPVVFAIIDELARMSKQLTFGKNQNSR